MLPIPLSESRRKRTPAAELPAATRHDARPSEAANPNARHTRWPARSAHRLFLAGHARSRPPTNQIPDSRLERSVDAWQMAEVVMTRRPYRFTPQLTVSQRRLHSLTL